MAELARGGASEGLWLRAERQTAGKGRHGRPWESPVGNLYVSTVIRLRPSDPPPATLALVAAVALEETVSVFGVRPMLKWPNDLLVDGAKLSGILLERADDAVVVGFGVNLAHCPAGVGQPATSIAIYSPAPDPETFAETLAESFGRWVERWRGEGLAPIRERWLARAHPIGTALTARLADGSSLDGLFGGLDRDGALILRLADGSVRAIHAGDVFLL
jgi:BirA family transcriptional regulator, biotin operon repressor / biotin---[acetyl-CoA-carboxylase] ligase